MFLTDPRNGNAAGVSTTAPLHRSSVPTMTCTSARGESRQRLARLPAALQQRPDATKTPGAFGWDNTPAIVSTSMVTSYTGTSTYLLLSNYNDYVAQVDGQGVNKVALLDPTATETDSHSSSNGLTVMREVLNIAGPTPDAANQNSTFPSRGVAVAWERIRCECVDQDGHSSVVRRQSLSLERRHQLDLAVPESRRSGRLAERSDRCGPRRLDVLVNGSTLNRYKHSAASASM